jgi:hypothetical protein
MTIGSVVCGRSAADGGSIGSGSANSISDGGTEVGAAVLAGRVLAAAVVADAVVGGSVVAGSVVAGGGSVVAGAMETGAVVAGAAELSGCLRWLGTASVRLACFAPGRYSLVTAVAPVALADPPPIPEIHSPWGPHPIRPENMKAPTANASNMTLLSEA